MLRTNREWDRSYQVHCFHNLKGKTDWQSTKGPKAEKPRDNRVKTGSWQVHQSGSPASLPAVRREALYELIWMANGS